MLKILTVMSQPRPPIRKTCSEIKLKEKKTLPKILDFKIMLFLQILSLFCRILNLQLVTITLRLSDTLELGRNLIVSGFLRKYESKWSFRYCCLFYIPISVSNITTLLRRDFHFKFLKIKFFCIFYVYRRHGLKPWNILAFLKKLTFKNFIGFQDYGILFFSNRW